ncbi:MAG: cofactor-independent phosphoglycerate mutase [Proteobacteria bacterium]|nr:cofactor-independent phosphoglycerate mutase [Pseudomonadota bacterium]
MKRLIIVCDGMSDYPIKKLGNKTPLMVAKKPLMDKLALEGATGTFKTVPDDLPPGSEVANLSIIGYDPRENYCQRGVLEAASLGVSLNPKDLAMRCNLVYVKDDKMESHSGGDLEHKEAGEILNLLNEKLGEKDIKFYQGFHYRHLLVIGGGSDRIKCYPPHDYLGEKYKSIMVESGGTEGKATAETLNKLIMRSKTILEKLPSNIEKAKKNLKHPNLIWPWAQGYKPKMKTIRELTGLSGATITAVDLIKGLSIYAGMDIIKVDGATGNYKTNYEGKARAALSALEKYDYVYLHVEAADEASHDGDLDLKIKVIEDINNRLLAPILKGIAEKRIDVRIALLPDHSTPVEFRNHVKVPVPVILWGSGIKPDNVQVFDEISVKEGSLKEMNQKDFFRSFLMPVQYQR